jgi:predicted Ser/Thr protein kinase
MDDTISPVAQPPLVADNPYFHRGAIKAQEYFFGRERETREILGAVKGGQCVSIVGPWHIGKTSLLFHVKSAQVLRKYGLAPDKFVMVYCTGQGLRGDDQSNLCSYLLKKLQPYEAVERSSGVPLDLDRSKLLELLTTRLSLEELRTLCFTLEEKVKDLTYDDLPGEVLEAKARELIAFLARRDQLGLLLVKLFEQRPDLADERATLFVLDGRRISGGSPDLSLDVAYHELDELVKRLTQRGLRIVLLLDEFELFAANPNTQESFFRNLQALQAEHALTVVTSSRISLHELSDLDGAYLPRRFFLMFLPLNLGLFSSDEAISLITEPSRRAGIAFSEPTEEFILDVAGLHPFFLQVTCDAVFDRRCAKPQLDASDYDGLRQEIGKQLKGMFRYYWEMLDPEQQSALVDLEADQAGPGRGQRLEELAQQGLAVRKGQVYDYVSTSFREFVQKHQSTSAVRLGSVRILEEIGSGEMGTVYKAYQSSLKRYVAVKVLARDAKREGFQQRFEQEAQALARLRHANILSIHGFDQEGERAYIVMDYVSGGTLANLISDGMPLRDAIDIAVQIGDALHYAHQRGIVHRDVKPTNVLIDEDGRPLLTDFGLVKLLTAPEPLTEPGVGMGTAAYMAPEQASGKDVDERSDVYALGIVLYEMVTGRLPFEAEDGITVVLQKLKEPPPPPSRFNTDLPAEMEQVILKAIARLPEGRYQSALEMTEALRALQSVIS